MFKARILVHKETDVTSELAKIENLAKRSHLDDAKTLIMTKNIESVLMGMKQQDLETAAYGINTAIKKIISTSDYRIIIELRPRKGSFLKKNPFSWLFDR